jgi:hypothetical protein
MVIEKLGSSFKAVLIGALLATSLAAGSDANAGTCKTVSYFPGVIQVFGTAKDTTGSGDSAYCTAVNACPAGARKVEVFGGAIATKSGATLAVANVGRLTGGEEAVSACDFTIDKNGKRIGSGVCQNEAVAQEAQGTATEAECSLYVTTTAGGETVANASCFCGE